MPAPTLSLYWPLSIRQKWQKSSFEASLPRRPSPLRLPQKIGRKAPRLVPHLDLHSQEQGGKAGKDAHFPAPGPPGQPLCFSIKASYQGQDQVRALPLVEKRWPHGSRPGRAGPLKARASCARGPSHAIATARARPRRGSHLNFSSPSAARRRRSAGGGRPFARVGGTTSGSGRPAPGTRGHSRENQNKAKCAPPPETARLALHRPRPVAPCLSPPPAARSRDRESPGPLAAPSPAAPGGNSSAARPERTCPPPAEVREGRGSRSSQRGPGECPSQRTRFSFHWQTFRPLISTSWRTFFT